MVEICGEPIIGDLISDQRKTVAFFEKHITYVYDRQKELVCKIQFDPIHPHSHSPLFFEFSVHPRLLEFHRFYIL